MENRTRALFVLAVIGLFLAIWLAPLAGNAGVAVAAIMPETAVFDDFEDGDTADWGFFGGNLAGGGGGPATDRPKEGAVYLSTGWGGEGSASVFYGGAFRNLDNAAQVVPPADPWFNVWVLNQSNTTVDSYTLEITIREDLDGNGWTDGQEDSFRLDNTFTASDFNDTWTLISAPVSSFANMSTGGDGVFNGNLDELVLVISGVSGASGSVVEVDFDYFAFTTGGPLAFAEVLFDNMEHGDPFANGWFAFGGAVGGGGIGADPDVPPALGGAFSLGTGWGSGGVPGFYGGFGRTFPVDLSGTTHFNFWVNPDEGQDYTLELNLQEDDNSDGAINAPDDDEFQYNCVISAVGPCAISGGGWQLVSIPLDDFFDDNSFLFGGNGVLDPVPAARGGNGELINVVVAVIGNSGSDATFRTDYWAFTDGPLQLTDPGTPVLIEDFENGPVSADPCPTGVPPLGFCTFNDPNSTVSLTTTDAPPTAVPNSAAGNNVLQVDTNVNDSFGFAGFINGFANAAGDAPEPQNWSGSEGISFWLYGNNSGKILFFDVLDNRTPESTSDTAERYSIDIIDDFSGWRYFEVPFAAFNRKEVGNGAPNDGFTLTDVHGFAWGVFNAGLPLTNYLDDVALYGEAAIPPLSVAYDRDSYSVTEGGQATITVKLNRPFGQPDDPTEVSVDYLVEGRTAVPDRDVVLTSGTLTFTDGGPSSLTFTVDTIDNDKRDYVKLAMLRLANPVGAEAGFVMQATLLIQDDERADNLLLDDFERGAYLWSHSADIVLTTPELMAGDPLAVPGQGAYESVLLAAPQAGPSPMAQLETAVSELNLLLTGTNTPADQRRLSNAVQALQESMTPDLWQNAYYLQDGAGVRSLVYLQLAARELMKVSVDVTPVLDALAAAAENIVQLAMNRAVVNNGDAWRLARADAELARAEAAIADGRYDQAMRYYRGAWLQIARSLQGVALAPTTFSREYAIGQDWSGAEALSFQYYGQGTGETVTVQLLDNRAADPGPAGWSMVWSDEFNDPAGTPPNPDNWSFEIGDVTPDGSNGWGNDELQYYTDDPANAATDGAGNMLLTLKEADGSLTCYYGPCEYTSARLISKGKAEFAYGRIESRIQVPQGTGIWPAFWSLGTDIDEVSWPQTGEIDFMEFVGRLPNEIFGTIHGPGYAGGQSYGGIYDFGAPVYTDYHTYVVEWEPNLIRWYVDGILYHTAAPGDVAPNEWVFNDPVFLLLNVAIGGNFGGTVGDDFTPPQSMKVDYIRVYQGPDTAERFETTFVDDFTGWQEVVVPFNSFVRSSQQPAGAPDDGLTLSDVWGYGFSYDNPSAVGATWLDQVRLVPVPAPDTITVTNLNDSGDGSLRQALTAIATDGTITFDPSLANGTITLTSGQLVIGRSVTVDGSDAPGLAISGNNSSRVLQVNAGNQVTLNNIIITEGAGAPQGGGILNYGVLTLNEVTVTNNNETSAGPANFEFGGGGIYNGSGAVLNLNNSTVSNNTSLNQPGGGVYGFFGSTLNITGSTISGNVAAVDVAGGIRSLGNVTIVNSTLSGNVSTAWHGGAIFHTDGQLTITNATITGNTAPGGTAAGVVVATFGGGTPNMSLTNTIIANNIGGFDCAVENQGGAGTITSVGGNIDSDGTCGLTAVTDQQVTDPLLGPLAANGGPTLTHALLAGSPAIDAGIAAGCPATDQRGVARDAACDVGAYEFVP